MEKQMIVSIVTGVFSSLIVSMIGYWIYLSKEKYKKRNVLVEEVIRNLVRFYQNASYYIHDRDQILKDTFDDTIEGMMDLSASIFLLSINIHDDSLYDTATKKMQTLATKFAESNPKENQELLGEHYKWLTDQLKAVVKRYM